MSIGFSSFLNPNAIQIDVRESTEDPLVNGLCV